MAPRALQEAGKLHERLVLRGVDSSKHLNRASYIASHRVLRSLEGFCVRGVISPPCCFFKGFRLIRLPGLKNREFQDPPLDLILGWIGLWVGPCKPSRLVRPLALHEALGENAAEIKKNNRDGLGPHSRGRSMRTMVYRLRV